MREQLHKVQVSILDTLRHAREASFSALMKPTGMESDTFKFHIRKLQTLGYVEKGETGLYSLTPVGKEFANDLDDQRRAVQKQPKLSLIVTVRKPDAEDEPMYLFQKRLRHPFFGYWGGISGPVRWGEEIETTAAAELKKQTGLDATCSVRSFYRKRDYSETDNTLLEDKLFALVEATGVEGKLTNTWKNGHNQWMTLNELQSQDHYFADTVELVKATENGAAYRSQHAAYTVEDY